MYWNAFLNFAFEWLLQWNINHKTIMKHKIGQEKANIILIIYFYMFRFHFNLNIFVILSTAST